MNLIKISEATSLALHTMTLLAKYPIKRLNVPDIAERLGASSHHLAKVMQRLEKAGLVNSLRGPQGGFKLAKPTEEIQLLQIFEAIEGPIGKPGCMLTKPACDGGGCVLGTLVHSIHTQVRDYLTNTTLSQLTKTMNFNIALSIF